MASLPVEDDLGSGDGEYNTGDYSNTIFDESSTKQLEYENDSSSVIPSGEGNSNINSDFGRFGLLAFGLALGVALVLLIALLYVVLLPR